VIDTRPTTYWVPGLRSQVSGLGSWARSDGVALSLVGDAILKWQSRGGARKAQSVQLAGAGGGGAHGGAPTASLIAGGVLERPTLVADAHPDKDAAHSRLQPGPLPDTQCDRAHAPKTARWAAGPRARRQARSSHPGRSTRDAMLSA
jgi:hypothetical protein